MNNLKITKATLATFDKTLKGAKADQFTCPALIKEIQSLASAVRKATAKKTLTDAEVTKLSSNVTELRYKMAFNKSQSVLTYLMEKEINPCKVSRNVYGKVSQGVTLIQKGIIQDFEQSDYVKQVITRLLGMEKIDADFTFTAGQLAKVQGKIKENGSIVGMSTSTQPYATFEALKMIGAGFITEKQDRSDSWKLRKFTIEASSPFAQAFNALCKD